MTQSIVFPPLFTLTKQESWRDSEKTLVQDVSMTLANSEKTDTIGTSRNLQNRQQLLTTSSVYEDLPRDWN